MLEVVQELAELGQYDFDVVFDKASYGNSLYYLQYDLLGTDRSTTLVFDLNLDNIQGLISTANGSRKRRFAIVGGQGQAAAARQSFARGPTKAHPTITRSLSMRAQHEHGTQQHR